MYLFLLGWYATGAGKGFKVSMAIFPPAVVVYKILSPREAFLRCTCSSVFQHGTDKITDFYKYPLQINWSSQCP